MWDLYLLIFFFNNLNMAGGGTKGNQGNFGPSLDGSSERPVEQKQKIREHTEIFLAIYFFTCSCVINAGEITI